MTQAISADKIKNDALPNPAGVYPDKVEFNIANSYPYNHRSAGAWLRSHLFRYPWLLVSVVINAVGNAAGAFAVPYLIGQAFNIWLTPSPENIDRIGQIAICALLIPVSQLLRAIFLTLRNLSSEGIGKSIELNVRDELYVSLLGKSMAFHTMQATGDIMARATNDVREIDMMFSHGVNMTLGSAMFVVLPFVLSPLIHPALLLVPTLFTISLFISMYLYSSQLRPATEAVRAEFGTMNAGLAEAISGIETVKGAAAEGREMSRFSAAANTVRDAVVRQSDIEARFIPLLLLGVASGGAFLHALILYTQNLIQVGDIITYMGYLQLFGFPTWTSLYAFSMVSLGLAASRRIYSVIMARTDLDKNESGHVETIEGEVRFADVTFQYPGSEHPALEKVSFTVKPGQVVAVTGQTGAGKSTLARLLNRTYDPDSGSVSIDGIDVREWQLDSLRSQISIIEQDVFLFSRTIAENIGFGAEDATQEQIEYAAKQAQAHDFIMNFKDGYQTEVGERGVTLSGGQRQRIALARAFLTNPRILILDDSTSAIDSATEDQIQRAIHAATQGRTTFLITHRLSQIRWADQVIVLRKGRTEAIGTHEELLKSTESYRRIFAAYDSPNRTRPNISRETVQAALNGSMNGSHAVADRP